MSLRRWQLSATDLIPHLTLAADSRLVETDYLDDQAWRMTLGQGDSAALTLQSKFGGRVGLLSLVPMWMHDGKLLYEADAYAKALSITHFTPNYAKIDGDLLPDVGVEFVFWVIDSHTLAGTVTIENNTRQAVPLQLDWFGHVGKEGRSQALNIITMPNNRHALHFGTLKNINPVLVVEDGSTDLLEGLPSSPKVGRNLKVPRRKSQQIRWLFTGLGSVDGALFYADQWFQQNWDAHLAQVNQAATAIPVYKTGNPEWDGVIARSVNMTAQAMLSPTKQLAHPSFVQTRNQNSGYSRKQDGRHPTREWSGQDPHTAVLLAPVVASIQSSLGQGIIENYLDHQSENGSIDAQPGLGGQRAGYLCPPILARMTWQVYEQTEDAEFLRRCYSKLLAFVQHWLTHDTWQDERQMGYLAFPIFGRGRLWSQAVDVQTVASPDFFAYLLSEMEHLKRIAEVLGRKTTQLNKPYKHLQEKLAALWHDDRYAYHDVLTGQHNQGVVLLENGQGSTEHRLDVSFDEPQRLLCTIRGGVRHQPSLTLRIEGRDHNGDTVQEVAYADQFYWQRQGTYTTQYAYSAVTSLTCEGLSRVYRVSLATVDHQSHDINSLLPLIVSELPAAKRKKLVADALDKNKFLRPNGITMLSAKDPNFDPSNAKGAGGVWLYFGSLLGMALQTLGEDRATGNLVKDMLNAQVKILQRDGSFYHFYNSDEPRGSGEVDHLAGIAPLALMQSAIGIRIINANRVWVGGSFAWGRSITVQQHGVTVKRSTKSIQVDFPSGKKVELDGSAAWQVIIDEQTKTRKRRSTKPKIERPKPSTPPPAPNGKITIDVEVED